MAEEGQTLTLQQRIAALNASHIRSPAALPPFRSTPPVAQKKPLLPTRNSNVNAAIEQTGSKTGGFRYEGRPTDSVLAAHPPGHTLERVQKQKPPPPPLPKRTSIQTAPVLPPRRPSEQHSRQDSHDSVASSVSGKSSLVLTPTRSRESPSTRIKAPAWGDTELPTLPQRNSSSSVTTFSSERPKYHCRAPSANEIPQPVHKESAEPALPPRLPARRQTDHPVDIPPDSLQPRSIPHTSAGRNGAKVPSSALSFALNKPQPPKLPAARPSENMEKSYAKPIQGDLHSPPAIPLSSRPDLSAIQATKPRPTSPTRTLSCMICRDFSGPDNHAAQFPRHQVSSLANLAVSLTSPFPSPTDKARAIFTWLHHNVAYDTKNFFSGTVKRTSPEDVLRSGLAVCEGYSQLFKTLADHAGLDSVRISGHGKGYGYSPLQSSSPIPAISSNHAWNAVRIDHGEWKLIDSCWGAGHVQGAGQPYAQHFHPQFFTMTNTEFALEHFPLTPHLTPAHDHFFLPDNATFSWAEYMHINPDSWPHIDDPPTVFSDAGPTHGIGDRSICPRSKTIPVHSSNPHSTITFSFALHCPHWILEQHTRRGPPPVFILASFGATGTDNDFLPFTHIHAPGGNGAGDSWVLEVEARRLGVPGQTLTLFAVTTFGDRKGGDARGLTVSEFEAGKGRVAMGFEGVAAWELV